MPTLDESELQSALENPELAAAAAKAVQGSAGEAPTIPDPLDGPVRLPGGLIRTPVDQPTVKITTAWIRELNGEDEERIARARMKDDRIAFVDALLVSGVSRLGDHKPTVEDLRELLVGDRQFLLGEISKATYGNDVDFDDYICPKCQGKLSFVVHLDEDVPTSKLEKPEDSVFEVPLKNNRIAVVNLPTGDNDASLEQAETAAEMNTMVLAACVDEIRDASGKSTIVAGDADTVRELSIRDRTTILEKMSKKMPGPRYNEVKFTHPDCGNEVRVTVSLGDLFRGL